MSNSTTEVFTSVTDDNVLSGLYLNMGLAGGLLILFCLFQAWGPAAKLYRFRVFSDSVTLKPPDILVHLPGWRKFFAWFIYTWRANDLDVLMSCGLDAYVMLKIPVIGCQLFAPMALIGVGVLIPVHVSMDWLTEQGANVNSSNLSRLTVSAVRPRDNMLWLHTILVILYTAYGLFLLHHNFLQFARLRLMYLKRGDDLGFYAEILSGQIQEKRKQLSKLEQADSGATEAQREGVRQSIRNLETGLAKVETAMQVVRARMEELQRIRAELHHGPPLAAVQQQFTQGSGYRVKDKEIREHRWGKGKKLKAQALGEAVEDDESGDSPDPEQPPHEPSGVGKFAQTDIKELQATMPKGVFLERPSARYQATTLAQAANVRGWPGLSSISQVSKPAHHPDPAAPMARDTPCSASAVQDKTWADLPWGDLNHMHEPHLQAVQLQRYAILVTDVHAPPYVGMKRGTCPVDVDTQDDLAPATWQGITKFKQRRSNRALEWLSSWLFPSFGSLAEILQELQHVNKLDAGSAESNTLAGDVEMAVMDSGSLTLSAGSDVPTSPMVAANLLRLQNTVRKRTNSKTSLPRTAPAPSSPPAAASTPPTPAAAASTPPTPPAATVDVTLSFPQGKPPPALASPNGNASEVSTSPARSREPRTTNAQQGSSSRGRARRLWAVARNAVWSGKVASLPASPAYDVVSSLFKGLFPDDFDRALPIMDYRRLQVMMRFWNNHLMGLESALETLAQEGRRPWHYPCTAGCLRSYRVDSISWLTELVGRCQRDIIEERRRAINGEKGNTGCYIVLFKSQAAAALAATQSSVLAQNKDRFLIHPAPSPANMNWQALLTPAPSRARWTFWMNFAKFAVVMWPVAAFSSMFMQLDWVFCPAEKHASEPGAPPPQQSAEWSWKWYCHQDDIFAWLLKKVIIGWLPSVLLAVYSGMILPNALHGLCQASRNHLSFIDLDKNICSLYFQFNVWNVFFSGMLGGSFLQQANQAVFNKGFFGFITLVGISLPSSSNFFINYLCHRALFSFTSKLLLPHGGVGLFLFKRYLRVFKVWSPREMMFKLYTCRSMRYGPEIGNLTMAFVVGCAFAVVSPVVPLMALIFFIVAYFVFKHQLLYIFVRKYEAGGVFFDLIYRKLLECLMLMVVFSACVIGVKGGYAQFWILVLFVVYPIHYVSKRTRRQFQPMLNGRLPLEVAAHAPRASVDPVLYTHPALHPQALGWHPDVHQVWSGLCIWGTF